MYADYYSSTVEPEKDESNTLSCVLSSSSNAIKCGGSYKLITATFYDAENNDITNKFLDSVLSWSCSIDGEDFTSSNLISWKQQENNNEIRVKIDDMREYLTKILTIKCSAENGVFGEIQLEISAM